MDLAGSLEMQTEPCVLEMGEDLMLVDWLCLDFRQRLLGVLQTSCQNNLDEARKLAKEKLLDLLDRMDVNAPEPLDLHLQILSPTPPDWLNPMPCTLPSLATTLQHETPEVEGITNPQQAIAWEDTAPGTALRTEADNCEVTHRSSGGAVPCMLLDNSGLPSDCSDFMEFDLLQDGEVFSIGVNVGEQSNGGGSAPLEYNLSESKLGMSRDTSSTTSIASTDTDSTHHVHSPYPVPGPPAPSLTVGSSTQGSSLQVEQSAVANHPCSSTSGRRQKKSCVSTRAVRRRTTSSNPNAGTPEEDEHEGVESAALLSLMGRAHLVPSNLPSSGTVLDSFTRRLGEEKQCIAGFLTRLFYAIGSPDALCQLQHAVKLGREKQSVLPVCSGNDLASTVQLLDHLDSMTSLSHILRRYYLVRLLEHRIRLEQDHVDAKLAWRRPKRMLKYDSARLELVKNGGTLSRVDENSKPQPKYRPKSQALADLMHVLYPDLKPAAGEGKDCVYSGRLTKLRNRLSCARNWYKFEQTFTGGILALIPCAGRFSISIDQVEKLPSDTLQVFLKYLQEHRGPFLHRISQTLSTDLYSVLAGTDTTPEFCFEKMDEDSLGAILFDSEDLVNLCKRV